MKEKTGDIPQPITKSSNCYIAAQNNEVVILLLTTGKQ